MASDSLQSKEYLFEQMPIPKAVSKMAIPMIISSLVTVLYNLADTYFVGLLNDPIQNAAVTLSYPVLLGFSSITNLFGTGTSSKMSRALGQKQYENVRRSAAFGFYCALGCALVFSLICLFFEEPLLTLLGADSSTAGATGEYLYWTVIWGAIPSVLNVVLAYMVRSEGSAFHASIGTMTGCILNILLDPFFIMPWGLNMGAAGAGCATFVSNVVALIYYLILIWRKRRTTFVCLNPQKIGWEKDVSMEILGVGLPATVQNVLNVTGLTILNNFTAAYGAEAVAAMGIASKLHMVPIQMVMGSSHGIMPLIGYNYSSGNRKRMKNCILFSLSVMIPVMGSVTLIYWLFSRPLVGLFIDNETIIRYGIQFVRGQSLPLMFHCLDFFCVFVFQALGRGRVALIFAVMRKIFLEIPSLFILNRIFPLYGLAYAQLVSEIILAAAALVLFRRIFQESEPVFPIKSPK